ncbi:glycosyltransferase family 2 protein [Ruminococcus sp. YE78]|nr:glycosyltransferase family 2 protein [Ruminococcus sp. YE78]
MNNLPFVSALLVTRNEEDYIENAMLSLINQSYPKDKYEIIVIDGESTDSTLSIVNKLIEEYNTDCFRIRLLSNPKHILSSGWNIGIKASKGEYVVRIDAHAEAANDFLEKNVETILSVPDAICVGGKLTTKSLNSEDDIISKVLSSSFGVGNSSFRVSNSASYADTAVYGLYKKEIFDKVGYFNEEYVRNQDIELHSRIRAVGGKFYFNPKIKSVYYSRNSTKKMVKQAFGNGKWNMVLLKNQNSALRLRHLIPFAFVIYLIFSTIMGFVKKWFWVQEAGVIIIHLSSGVIAAIKKTKKMAEIAKMPFLFLLLHLSYGSGYLSGVFTRINKKQ